jgi:hypothetical protein
LPLADKCSYVQYAGRVRALLRYRDGRTAELELVDPTTLTIRLAELIPVRGNGRRETQVQYRLFRRQGAQADGAAIFEECEAGGRA